MQKKQKYYLHHATACKIRKIAIDMMSKNKIYTMTDFELAWVKFQDDVNMLSSGNFINMLSSGNLKISKKIGIWDMPEIITCKGACTSCYAVKASRIYKNTRVYRLKHLLYVLLAIYSIKFRKIFINNMIINCKKYNIIRFHGAGDFFNNEYLKIMLQVITACHDIQFYTYTKAIDHAHVDYINETYKNFNIIKSIIKVNNETFINFGGHDYIDNVHEKLKQNNMPCFICNYQNMQHGACMDTCHACLNCPHVLFYKH